MYFVNIIFLASQIFCEYHPLVGFQGKQGDVVALSTTAEQLAQTGEAASLAAKERVKAFREQWDALHATVRERVKLATSYVAFHKKAQTVSTFNIYFTRIVLTVLRC